MDEKDLHIEKLRSIDQYHACEALQAKVWNAIDRDVVPLHVLVTMQRNGGLVLGAFDRSGQMVGFLFGFLGAREGKIQRLKHCSHMMGIEKAWRGRGVGRQLKLAQRHEALAQGLELVTWTVDPLESLNAQLNIGALGAVTHTYIRDLYGPMDDGLNADLSTDRFQIEWWIGSRHVRKRLEAGRAAPYVDRVPDRELVLNPATIDRKGLPRPSSTIRPPDGPVAVVEIPTRIQTVKATDLTLARAWRAQTRELFETSFDAGYTVTDYLWPGRDAPVGRYVLRREVEGI